jgi:predicted small lipoprotein YifL
MKSIRNLFSGYLRAALLASSVLLVACGQTGDLYMPSPHSTPAPPPGKLQMEKRAQSAPGENTVNDTKKANQER